MEAIKINPLARWQISFEQVEAKTYDREKAIEMKTDEIYKKLSPEDYLEIENKIIKGFGLNDINPDNTQKALIYLIKLEAEFLVDEEHKQIMKFGRY